jgi:hypothetical protein
MSRPKDPTLHRARVNGIELAYFEWGRAVQGRDATLLLAHATGFHARVWDQMIGHWPRSCASSTCTTWSAWGTRWAGTP